MSLILPQRKLMAGLGLFSLGVLAGCGEGKKLHFKYGKDLSDQILGRTSG